MVNMKEKQLKQLKQIQRTFDKFVKSVENEKIVIIDGNYQDEIVIDNVENPMTNSLMISIDYIEPHI